MKRGHGHQEIAQSEGTQHQQFRPAVRCRRRNGHCSTSPADPQIRANVHFSEWLPRRLAAERPAITVIGDVRHLHAHPEMVTTTKIRSSSGGQVMLRIDDSAKAVPAESLAVLAASVRDAVDHQDAVAVCDYGTGVLAGPVRESLIEALAPPEQRHERRSLTVVDAHDPRYRGSFADTALSIDELALELEAHRSQGQRIVLTNGCFDVLHKGHTRYLNQAKQLGDILVVALNSDESVRRLKGADRPINTEVDRAAVIAALSCVDYVTVFDTPRPAR